MVQTFIKSIVFLNIHDCIVTVYVAYKERWLSLPNKLKFANFSNFIEREVERLRGSQTNSSLNPLINFVIKAYIFTICISYDMRGLHLFIEWGITNFSDYSKGERESLRCGWVKFPSILLGMHIYLNFLGTC